MPLLLKSKLVIIISIILIAAALIYSYQQSKTRNRPNNNQGQEKQLKIVSTNPEPLNEATILPIQNIEITFNMPIVKSEVKHKFDPENLEYDLEVVNGINTNYGQTFRFKFKKPLKLGSGFTLFILPNTHSEDGIKLNQEFIYHIKTINYQGV